MNIIVKGIQRAGYCCGTVLSKLQYRGLTVNGLFRRRRDTQIILSDNGKMAIGKDVRFQRNVALTSVGGGY